MEKYILIFEDQSFKWTKEITDADIQSVAYGYMDIIRQSDLKFLDANGEWENIEEFSY